MDRTQESNWQKVIEKLNDISCERGISFTKLEWELMRCYWQGMNRQDILKVLKTKRFELKYYYNDNYFFSLGLEPELMKKLSKSIGFSVNKSNFKEVIQHCLI